MITYTKYKTYLAKLDERELLREICLELYFIQDSLNRLEEK